MQEIIIKTPAKINFGLNVINKRDDGYHNIETVFYPINLYDVIKFRVSDQLTFNTDSEQLSAESDNLILKTVKLLEKHTAKKITPEIFLNKNIPIGAGLGGGSSDAAATLKALNELYELRLNKKELLSLASNLGSDAPFFIDNVPSYATSRGEILREIDFRVPFPVLLVNPGIHISTKWAYDNIDPQKPIQNLLQVIKEISDWSAYKNTIYNDFEKVILSRFSELNEIKQVMYSTGALFSLMTGSGSTFFGIFPETNSIKKAEIHFKKLNYFTFINE